MAPKLTLWLVNALVVGFKYRGKRPAAGPVMRLLASISIRMTPSLRSPYDGSPVASLSAMNSS